MPLSDRESLLGPRVILKQLRSLMAGRYSPQGRLDKIVQMIAVNMVAEVCSVYLLRGTGDLELFATEGLNVDAVHKTMLKVGEGLVGHIAETSRPLNLSDAPSHPEFAYRQETGEEAFQSFLGVPVLRGGLMTGVLVVQNQVKKFYSDEEVETLEIVAMVLAEMNASADLLGDDEYMVSIYQLHPPSTIILCPVIYFDPSDNKKIRTSVRSFTFAILLPKTTFLGE